MHRKHVTIGAVQPRENEHLLTNSQVFERASDAWFEH
jgi:hypothetical protein